MKKTMAVILVLTLLLTMAGCTANTTSSAVSSAKTANSSSKSSASVAASSAVSATVTSKPAATSSAATSSKSSSSASSSKENPPESSTSSASATAYDQLLANYRQAISEQWDGETLVQNDMSELLLDKSNDEVGYCLLDVDNDGTDEFLIGSCTGDAYPDQMIFDLYTLQDGTPVHLFSGQSRSRTYLYQDEAAKDYYYFYNENSSDAFQSSYLSMHMSDGKLVIDQAVIYDAKTDSQNPWFSGSDHDGVLQSDSPMEESLANSIIASYQSQVMSPPFTSL